MTRILVCYYSSYGHVEQMAYAQAEGARRVAGAEVTVKRVRELMTDEAARAAKMKVDQPAPTALDEGRRGQAVDQPAGGSEDVHAPRSSPALPRGCTTKLRAG